MASTQDPTGSRQGRDRLRGSSAFQSLAKEPKATVEIDAHRIRGQPAEVGDLSAAEAFDEAQNQRFPIGFGQFANGGDGFARLHRHVRSLPSDVRVRQFDLETLPAEMIGRAVPRQRGDPAAKRRRLAKAANHRPRLQEHFLSQIGCDIGRDARNQDGVDEAAKSQVQRPERLSIATLRGEDDGNVILDDGVRRNCDQSPPSAEAAACGAWARSR